MKIVKPLISIGLISVMLMGCGTANRNNDNMANNDNRPLGVRYNPNDTVTNNGFGVNDNRVGMNNNRGDGFGTTGTRDTRGGMNVTNRNNNDQNFRVADDIADSVARLKEVDRANVIVTNRNAYVAVKLNNSARHEMTKDVERKISKKARDVDKNLDHVYVSENPDFFARMNTYGNDIRSGRPVSGFFNDFNDMVQRVFPTSR